MRRVVVTKEEISFAFVGEEAQIDHIPFAEIIYVKEMVDVSCKDHTDENSKDFSHVLQIATRDDGYNSGRIYYLSTGSRDALTELLSDLTKKAKVCRLQAEARTGFQKFQLKIRKRYESHQFQALMALLIILVCFFPLMMNVDPSHKTLKIFHAEFRVHNLRVRIHLHADKE
jgi:hypothetical protein